MAWIKAIPYLLVGGLIVALLLLVWYFRSEYQTAVADVATYKAKNDELLKVNDQQAKVNLILTNQRVFDNTAVEALNAKLDTINEAATAQAQALVDLEDANPDVKAYVNTPVPTGLKRVHN